LDAAGPIADEHLAESGHDRRTMPTQLASLSYLSCSIRRQLIRFEKLTLPLFDPEEEAEKPPFVVSQVAVSLSFLTIEHIKVYE
jgi:hypothetical protein